MLIYVKKKKLFTDGQTDTFSIRILRTDGLIFFCLVNLDEFLE